MVILARGCRSPYVVYVGHGAGTRWQQGKTAQFLKKSSCCGLLRREVEKESGSGYGRKEGGGGDSPDFFSHSRILTPPCGDWVPWESPLGGAGPNSNRFTKLQDKM